MTHLQRTGVLAYREAFITRTSGAEPCWGTIRVGERLKVISRISGNDVTADGPHIEATNSEGYPAPAGITADPVVFAPRDGRLCVLLMRRAEPPFEGMWALPGGFMNSAEAPEETAQRKLTEKTGIGATHLEQLATYGRSGRDPRGWILAVAYLGLIDAAILREDETEARWHRTDELPELAFDHTRMVEDGIDRLRGKLWYSNIAAALLPERFTLAEARHIYEAISGVRYDVPNFRRALESSGMIHITDEVRRMPKGRPARLYEFVDRRTSWNSRRSRMLGVLREVSGEA
jgi:8-oxo-dGTP diphosphatase